MSRPSLYRLTQAVSLAVVPVLLVLFVALYERDPRLYIELLQEDHVVEWLTCGLLLLAGTVSVVVARRIRRRSNTWPWFFVVFSVLCIGGSLEEISWGQRLLDIDTPEFFRAHSDQRETNVHNVLQKTTQLKTKHVAGVCLFLYGVCLPWRGRFTGRRVETDSWFRLVSCLLGSSSGP